MKRQKRLSKIVDAVQEILGDGVKKKRLKRKKALNRFVEKMEARRDWLKDELAKGGLKKDGREQLTRHLETLEKQIKKTKEIQGDG